MEQTNFFCSGHMSFGLPVYIYEHINWLKLLIEFGDSGLWACIGAVFAIHCIESSVTIFSFPIHLLAEQSDCVESIYNIFFQYFVDANDLFLIIIISCVTSLVRLMNSIDMSVIFHRNRNTLQSILAKDHHNNSLIASHQTIYSPHRKCVWNILINRWINVLLSVFLSFLIL